MSYYFYGGTLPENNTEGNRNILLNVINTDPVLYIYNALNINSISDGYMIEIEFENDIWSGPFQDWLLLSSIIDIIFNDAEPESDPPRSVTTQVLAPTSSYDYTYNFNVGSRWLVVDSKQLFICFDNSAGNAVWVSNPPMSDILSVGVGTGVTGDSYPYDGSILQYDNTEGIWLAQPGKWGEISVPSSSMINSGSTGPAFSNLTGSVGTYLFSSSVDEQLYFTVVIPHNYAEETDIIPFVNYVPTSGSTGSIVWGLDYTWANTSDTFSSPSTITATTTGSNTTHVNSSLQFSSISGSSKLISSTILCRLYRNGTNVNDTYPNDVGLLSFGFKYQQIGTGSTQMNLK